MIYNVLEFLIGIGLFLLGLYNLSIYISQYIEDNYVNNFDALFQRKFVAVGTGIGLSIIAQSSSVVHSIGVNLVNKKLISLRNAFFIVIGSNIGTTITGYIVVLSTLDISLIFSSMIFFSILTALIAKSKNVKALALSLAGFSLLFIGLRIVSKSILPFEETIKNIFLMNNKPIVLFLYGLLFTAVFQSSSLIIAIIVTFASYNIISFEVACYIVMGMNIGTSSTAFIASIGSSRDAASVALFNLVFNIFGALLTAFLLLTNFFNSIFSIWQLNEATKIAMFHTLFTVVTSLVVLILIEDIINYFYKKKPVSS